MEDTTAKEDISKHSVQNLLSDIKAIKNNNSLAQSLEEAQAIYPKTPDFSASGVGVKTSFLAKINVGNKIAKMESYRLTGVNRLRNTILEMCEQLASTLKKPTEDSQRKLIQQVGFVDCELELFNSVITRLSKQFALLNANPTSDQPFKDAIIKENLALLVAQAIYSSSVLTPLTSEEKKEQAALEKETDQATTSSSSQVVDNSPGHPKFVQCLLAKTRGCLTLLENYSLTGKFGSSHLGGTVHKAKLASNGDSGTLIPLKVQSITEVNCQAIIEQVLLLRKDQLYQHPNILKLEHASGFFNADPEQPAKCPKYYLALAYEPINGGNLSSLADDQWPEPAILRVIWQALLALAYLHSKGIIHNNINPSNILLHNGNVKIANFGSAKYLTSFEPRVERETTTLRYMAPEMAKTFLKGSPATDEFTTAVDIWALGAVLFQMLEGECPFSDNNNEHVILATLATKGLALSKNWIYSIKIELLFSRMTTMDSYERASANELLMHSTFFEKTCKSSELAEFVKQSKMAKDQVQEGQSAFKVD